MEWAFCSFLSFTLVPLSKTACSYTYKVRPPVAGHCPPLSRDRAAMLRYDFLL
ncbi:hypothetical protein [Scytonema sp. NUACC21]